MSYPLSLLSTQCIVSELRAVICWVECAYKDNLRLQGQPATMIEKRLGIESLFTGADRAVVHCQSTSVISPGMLEYKSLIGGGSRPLSAKQWCSLRYSPPKHSYHQTAQACQVVRQSGGSVSKSVPARLLDLWSGFDRLQIR